MGAGSEGRKGGKEVTPEMSNRYAHLTKHRESPQFVKFFGQMFGIQGSLGVTEICQIMTEKWQVVTRDHEIIELQRADAIGSPAQKSALQRTGYG